MPADGFDLGTSDMITYENPSKSFNGSVIMKAVKTDKTVCKIFLCTIFSFGVFGSNAAKYTQQGLLHAVLEAYPKTHGAFVLTDIVAQDNGGL